MFVPVDVIFQEIHVDTSWGVHRLRFLVRSFGGDVVAIGE
jgi:hypothetical protein